MKPIKPRYNRTVSLNQEEYEKVKSFIKYGYKFSDIVDIGIMTIGKAIENAEAERLVAEGKA